MNVQLINRIGVRTSRAGNLHLLFAQGFDSKAEQDRYGAMMDELCSIVAVTYGGR
jgi:D-lactate dehydrogenase